MNEEKVEKKNSKWSRLLGTIMLDAIQILNHMKEHHPTSKLKRIGIVVQWESDEDQFTTHCSMRNRNLKETPLPTALGALDLAKDSYLFPEW